MAYDVSGSDPTGRSCKGITLEPARGHRRRPLYEAIEWAGLHLRRSAHSDSSSVIAEVLQTGRPVLSASFALEEAEEDARDLQALHLMRRSSPTTVLALPMQSHCGFGSIFSLSLPLAA